MNVRFRRNRRWAEWTRLSEGCYLLRTNLTDTDPATLWKRYIQLTDAKWAFRITKDELEIRPIWHQRQDRVLAHILVGFLAYVPWKTLAGWMRRSGLGDAPRTLIEELANIKSGDVVLPAKPRGGRPARTATCFTSTPSDLRIAWNCSVNFVSRSQTMYLVCSGKSSKNMHRFRACCAIQGPSGFAVMPAMWTRRVPGWMKNNTKYLTSPPRVQTFLEKKSHAHNVLLWILMNSSHVPSPRFHRRLDYDDERCPDNAFARSCRRSDGKSRPSDNAVSARSCPAVLSNGPK